MGRVEYWTLLCCLGCTGRVGAAEEVPRAPQPLRVVASGAPFGKTGLVRRSVPELQAAVARLFPGLCLDTSDLALEAPEGTGLPTRPTDPDSVRAEALARQVAVELTTVRPDLLPSCLVEPAPGCVPSALQALGARVFRRPLTTEEQRSLELLYQAGAEARDHRYGVTLVIEALLRSPEFLRQRALGAWSPTRPNFASSSAILARSGAASASISAKV